MKKGDTYMFYKSFYIGLVFFSAFASSNVFSWELISTLSSEGVHTFIIKCDNNVNKAVYLQQGTDKYEVSVSKIFRSLDAAADYSCKKL